MATIGGFTALLAGVIALTQTDLKRILAYSTISQLGLHVPGAGHRARWPGITAGMFHLFTHAFFKALLFLGAGSVMHAMGGVIDMRRIRRPAARMPTTHWTFLFGCLALAGRHSLRRLLEQRRHPGGGGRAGARGERALSWCFIGRHDVHGLPDGLLHVPAYFLTFHGEERVPAEAGHHAHESPPAMTGPLVILAIGALVGGGLFRMDARLRRGSCAARRRWPIWPGLARRACGDARGDRSTVGIAASARPWPWPASALAAVFYLGGRVRPNGWPAMNVGRPLLACRTASSSSTRFTTCLIVWPLLAGRPAGRLVRPLVDRRPGEPVRQHCRGPSARCCGRCKADWCSFMPWRWCWACWC